MSVDENGFFREATLRLCISLDIEAALKSCFENIKSFIPVYLMSMNIFDTELNALRIVPLVGTEISQISEQIRSLPRKKPKDDLLPG